MHGQSNAWLHDNSIPKNLRRNMTDAERLLWRHLRSQQMGVKFRRQHAFENFVLDFVCLTTMLVIELDGGQHAEQTSKDAQRTLALERAGFRVLRFWNNQVLSETAAVLDAIYSALNEPGKK